MIAIFPKEHGSEHTQVEMTHHKPFDKKHGLPEEILNKAILVDALPQPEKIEKKQAILYVNTKTKELVYEYVDIPPTQEELLQEAINKTQTPTEKYAALDLETVEVEVVRAAKIEVLKANCTQAIYGGFTSQTFQFGFNENDQANFTQQTLLVTQGLATEPILWKTKNAGVQEFTLEQYKVIIQDAAAHKMAQQKKYWELEAQVLAAATNEEVDAINW